MHQTRQPLGQTVAKKASDTHAQTCIHNKTNTGFQAGIPYTGRSRHASKKKQGGKETDGNTVTHAH